jgi:hypothetical protein
MLKGLKRLAGGGLLLREVRGLRREVAALQVSLGRVASALELANAHRWPQQVQPDPDAPAVVVAYVDDQQQAEFMDIELRLTTATGRPPTDDEVLQEYERRHLEVRS